MADSDLRRLERAALLGGIPDKAAWLRARVRAGLVSQDALESAAYLGHEVARLALGGVWASFPGVPSGIAGIADQHPDAAPLGRWARGLGGLAPVVRFVPPLVAGRPPTPRPVPLVIMVGIVVAQACWHGSRRAIDAAANFALQPTGDRREAWAKAWDRAGEARGWIVAPGDHVVAGVLTAASLALGSDAVVRAAAQRIAPALLGETTWEEVLRG